MFVKVTLFLIFSLFTFRAFSQENGIYRNQSDTSITTKAEDSTKGKKILNAVMKLFRIKPPDIKVQSKVFPDSGHIKMEDSSKISDAAKKEVGKIKNMGLNSITKLSGGAQFSFGLSNLNKYKSIFNGDTSMKSKFPVKIHGTITATGYYTDYLYPGQAPPANYLRWQITPSVEIFGIPFKAGVFLTSERNSFKSLEAFNLSFDFAKVREVINENIQKSLNAKQLEHSILNEDQMLKFTEFNQLQKTLNDKDFLSNIENEKKLLDQKSKLDSFSLAQNATQIQQAEADVNRYEAMLARYKEIEPTVQQFNEDEIKRKLRNEEENERSSIDQKLSGLSTPYGKYLSLLNSIKSFDIGNCNPVLSDLTMNGGLGMKGVNFALNPHNIFFGFTTGTTMIYTSIVSNNSWQYSGPDRRVSALRLGWGNADKALISATVLQGQDFTSTQNIAISDWPPAYFSNTVVSLSGKINYQGLLVSAEGAKSITTPIDQNQSRSILMPSAGIFSDNTPGGTAFSMSASGRLPFINTRLSGNWQQIGANYNSYGLAYISKDIQKYNLKADRDLWHHRITATLFVRKQQDDLLQTKEFQTINMTYGASASFHWKNLPVISLSYSPTAQYTVLHTNAKDSSLYASNLVTGTVTYTKQKGKCTSSTTLVLSTNQSEGINRYLNKTISLSQLLVINKLISFNAFGSYMDATGLMHFTSAMGQVSIDLTLQKGNILKSGLYYQYQSNITEKKGCFAAFGFNLSKIAALQFRGDYFFVNDVISENKQQSHYSVNSSLIIHL